MQNENEREAIERIFCDVLERHLKAEGYSVIREAPVPGGRIDLLCSRGDERLVIEAKRGATTQQVRSALGQLLFYAHYHPGASLAFASPWVPSADIVELLSHYGVSVLRVRSAVDVQEYAESANAVPEAMLDGEWWTTKEYADWSCARCDFFSYDFPAVRCLRPAQGTGGSIIRYPEWLDKRWQMRHHCERCNYDSEAAGGVPLFTDDRQVVYMQESVGPWEPLAGRSVAYRSRTVDA
jgi:hypothetical protein